MALYEYEYSISDDFTSLPEIKDLNITILQKQIDSEDLIPPPVHHILANIDDYNCIIYFEAELSSEEEDELTALIANHTGLLDDGTDPNDIPDFGEGGVGDLTFIFGDDPGDYYIKFKNNSWTVSAQFVFRGTNNIGIPKGIKAVLKGEGKIRLYDRTNSRIIFEWYNYDVSDWTIFSQSSNLVWPTSEAILELQGEKDSNYAYLSCFMICFSGVVTDNLPD